MTNEWQTSGFQPIVDLFETRTGIELRPERRRSAQRLLERLMRVHQCETTEEYYALAREDRCVFEQIVDALVVGETYFFREDEKFEFLQREVFSEWKSSSQQYFKAWCAGCSTGEEAYTLAIVLRREGLLERTSILATDISTEALRTAREATYGTWSLRGVARKEMADFIRDDGEGVELPEKLTERVEFRYHNLLDDAWNEESRISTNFDIILCRNVLMYFEPETVGEVAVRFERCLAPNGVLVTGPSDPSVSHVDGLSRLRGQNGVYEHEWRGSTSESRFRPNSTSEPSTRPHKEPRRKAPPTQSPCHPPTSEQAETGEPKADAWKTDEMPYKQRLHDLEQLAARDPDEAILQAKRLVEEHPLQIEGHHLRAVLLLECDRPEDAIEAARRGIYLDRTKCALHLTHAIALRRTGETERAGQAFHNAARLADDRPADETIPLTNGDRADELARYAFRQAERLGVDTDRQPEGSDR